MARTGNDRASDICGGEPGDGRHRRGKGFFTADRQHGYRQLALGEKRLVVDRILVKGGELRKSGMHGAGPRVERGIMLARSLIEILRIGGKFVPEAIEIPVAAAAYVEKHGKPACVADLETHRGILYGNREADWRFADAEGWVVARPRAALRVNNGLIMCDAAVEGLGISLLPSFHVNQALARGSLVKIDVGCDAEGAQPLVVYPRDNRASAKVLALIDSLRASFGDPPYWEGVVRRDGAS